MNTKKDLRKMGLIAGKKETNQLLKVGIAIWVVFAFILIYSLAK